MRKTILAGALVLFSMLVFAGPASADCSVGYADPGYADPGYSNGSCPPNVPPGGGGETGSAALPRTGNDSTMTLAKVGIVVLGVGGALFVLGNRRRGHSVPA